MGIPLVHYSSLSKSGKLNSGRYCGLSSEILSCAYVVARINGLKVFHDNDTLGDSCGVSQSSVNQSPGVLDGHRPFVLLPRKEPPEFNLHIRLPEDSAEHADVITAPHFVRGGQDGC